MEWHNVLYTQAFSRIGIMTNGYSTIDMNMFDGEWTIFMRLEFGRIKMNDKVFVSGLIVMMIMLAVCVMQVFIDGYLSAIANDLKVT
jgi:hypothetical protein